VHSWTYDAIGNRLTNTVNAITQNYTYQKIGANQNNCQRLTSDGTNNYTYDANGNTGNRTGFTFGWDYENRMTSITGTMSGSYAYDYYGRRTSKTVSGAATNYVYNGLNLISETSGEATTYHLFGPGIDEPLASNRGTAVVYHDIDGLGSVGLVTDAASTLQNSYIADVWGVSRASSESFQQPFRFTAREQGDLQDFNFYRARTYLSAVGRFLTEDPLANFDFSFGSEVIGPQLFKLGYTTTQSIIRRYAYVNSNPLTYTDPTGLKECCGGDFGDCWGDCIKRWRLDNLWPLTATTLPKRVLPPFRVVDRSQPFTTLMSSVGHMLGGSRSVVGRAMRATGRMLNPIADVATVFEGFWDLTIITECAGSCKMHPCGGGL